MGKRGRKPKEVVKSEGDSNRLNYLRREKILGKKIGELAGLVAEIQRLSSDPAGDFAKMSTEEDKSLIEDVIYPSILRGVNLNGITCVHEPIGVVCEDTVSEIYELIKRHLTKLGTWNDIIHGKFPPYAVRHAIRRAWFYLLGDFDWGVEFEHLRYADNIDDFIEELLERSNLKRDFTDSDFVKASHMVEREAKALDLVVVDRKEAEMLQALKMQRFRTHPSLGVDAVSPV